MLVALVRHEIGGRIEKKRRSWTYVHKTLCWNIYMIWLWCCCRCRCYCCVLLLPYSLLLLLLPILFFKYQITNGDDIDSSVMMTWKRARQIRTPSRTANPFQTKCSPIKSLSVISFTSDNSNDLFTKSLNYIFIRLMIQIFAFSSLHYFVSSSHSLSPTRSCLLVFTYSLSPVRPLSLSFKIFQNSSKKFQIIFLYYFSVQIDFHSETFCDLPEGNNEPIIMSLR